MASVIEGGAKKPQGDSLLKYMYPVTSFAAGTYMAYFPTYTSMLYTDIYFIPVVLSGILQLVAQFTRWFAGPIWGTVVDRVTLKRGKYWPWIAIGATVSAVAQMTIFGLPSLSKNPASLASVVFGLAVILSLAGVVQSTTLVSVYPRLADSPRDRTFLAMAQTVGRTAAKTIFGFFVPIWLLFFTKSGGSNAAGWATTGYIIGIIGLVLYLAFALVLKESSVEKQAIETKAKRRGGEGSLGRAFQGIMTNRALLVMFLVFTTIKVFDLGFQTNGASYFWKYYMKDFKSMSTFMTFRSLSHAIGASFGLIWLRALKDSKRAFFAAGLLDIGVLGAASLLLGKLSAMNYILLMSTGQFFRGLEEAYVLPFFAAACDWGTLKTGVRAEGLNMSVYSLTLTVAGLIGTTFTTAVLRSVGYNPAAYAKGAVPAQAVVSQIGRIAVWYPFILAIVAFTLFILFYPIDDKRLKEIKDELRAKEAAKSAA